MVCSSKVEYLRKIYLSFYANQSFIYLSSSPISMLECINSRIVLRIIHDGFFHIQKSLLNVIVNFLAQLCVS